MQRVQQTGEALGSKVQITLVDNGSEEMFNEIFSEIWKLINGFEARFSRFISSSELTKFNKSSGSKTKISNEFVKLLIETKKQSVNSFGIFNPFILPALQKSGYISSWPTPDKPSKINYEDRLVVEIDHLEIGKDWARIPKSTAIEFGGIGKGYLLDLLSNHLKNKTQGYWISIGGDIVCDGKDLDSQDWQVKIQHSVNQEEFAGSISNQNGSTLGVATSGITKRKGLNKNIKWHHIIDPRTNQPAKTDILTATVSASNATTADIIAKCLVIVGSKRSRKFFSSSEGSYAIIQIGSDKKVEKILRLKN